LGEALISVTFIIVIIRKEKRKEGMKMRKKMVLSGLIVAGLIMAVFFAAGHFSAPKVVFATQLTGLSGPRGVAIGDYNNDGLNELAVAEYGAGKVTVYKSDGVTVVKQWTGLSGPYGVAIGDYNNDGLSDLAFTEMDANRVTVYKNDGVTIIRQWTGLSGPSGVAIGDYNADGLNEIAIAEQFGNRVTVYNSGGAIIKQWTGLSGPYGVAIGVNDLAFSESSAGNVTVYENDGTTIIKQWTGLNSPGEVAIGAYDSVANNLAFTEYVNGTADKVTVYSSDGTNTISKQLTGLQNSWGLCIGDLNNDGINDLAFSEAGAGKVTVYYQTNAGSAARAITVNNSKSNNLRLSGTLTNSSGYPVQSGSMRISIREGSPNGTLVWQDTFNDTIYNGQYNIQLGSQKAIDPRLIKDNTQYFLIVEIDTNSTTFVSAKVTFGQNPNKPIICNSITLNSSRRQNY
jgi:hypothetical protein